MRSKMKTFMIVIIFYFALFAVVPGTGQSCTTPVMVLDMGAELAGDTTTDFLEYSYEINRKIIRESFKETSFLQNLPDHDIDRHARYPDSTICTEWK